MVANIALQDRKEFKSSGDNDNNSGAILTQKEIHPLALEGAKRLISRHSTKTPVIIKSWGTPDIVYADIRQSLVNLGYEIGMAEDMAGKLVEHAEFHAEASRAKYGANIIALKLEVSKEKPSPQFETGALESQKIDGFTNQAQVAGATTVAIGINTGGTFTTALRDSVSEIMEAMQGTSQAVWIDFEAPDKSELKGIANQVAISAMAQIVDGSLTPDLIAELQSYAEMNLLSSDIINVLEGLYKTKVEAVAGNHEAIRGISDILIENLSNGMENNNINPDVVTAAIEAIQLISDTHGLEAIIDMNGLMALRQDVQIAQFSEKLEIIAEGLDGAERTTLEKLIKQLNELEGADILSHLNTIQEHLESVGLKVNNLSILTADINSLKELVTQNLPLDQKLEVLAEIGAQDLMDLLQGLNGLDDLPPELSELLEQLDVESLTIEKLKEALAGKGEPAFIETVQNLVLTLQNPELQAALPQTALNQVNQFLTTQISLVEAVTVKAIVSDLATAIIDIDPSSPDAIQIQGIIDRLEAGKSINTIELTTIVAVTERLDISTAINLDTAIQTLQNVTAENITIGADTRIELNNIIQSGDLNDFVSSQVGQAIQSNELSLAVSARGLANYGLDTVLPPSDFPVSAVSQQVNAIIENNTQPSIPATNTIENLQDVTGVIQKFDSSTPPTVNEIIEAVQKLNTIKNIPPAEISQINAIKEKLISALPPEIKAEQVTALKQGYRPPEAKPAEALKKTEDKVSLQTPPKAEAKKTDLLKVYPDNQDTQKQDSLPSTQDGELQKEEPLFQTGCEACGGGNCASCGGAFNSVSAEQVSEAVIDISGLDNFSLSENSTEPSTLDDIKGDEPIFQTGCEACGGGNCASCGGAFAKVNSGDVENIVNEAIDLGNFSLSTPTLKAA